MGGQESDKARQTSPMQEGANPHASQMVVKSPNPHLSEITPGLFIGDHWSSTHLPILQQHQIKSILSVNEESSVMWRQPRFISLINQDRHLKIFCLDSSNQDLLIHMHRACEFIETSLAHGPVLVHCQKGISRSTAFLIAYLMRRHWRGLEKVLADVRSKRKVRPSQNFLTQLDLWGQLEYEVWEDEEKKVPRAPYAKLLKEKDLTAVLGPSRAQIAFGMY